MDKVTIETARAAPHDLFEIEKLIEELCGLLESVKINLKGLFLNADSGFDSQNLRPLRRSDGL